MRKVYKECKELHIGNKISIVRPLIDTAFYISTSNQAELNIMELIEVGNFIQELINEHHQIKCKSCNSDKVHKEEVTKDMITFKCMDCNFRQHFEKPFGGVSK